MQPPTPNRPISDTIFEAVQTLRPHPRIRHMSAPAPDTYPRHTVTPDTDRCSTPSGTTVVDRPETPHLYTSKWQHEVATGRMLGSLTRLETSICSISGSMSPKSNPLSPKSLVGRAKELLIARTPKTPKTPKTPQTPDTPRAEAPWVAVEKGSWDSLRSGFYSKKQVFEFSAISDEPPQIAPLRPVSKFLPDLTIFVPGNDVASEFVVEHSSIENGDEAFNEFSETSYNGSSVFAPLRLCSSIVDSVSRREGTTAETTFYTAGETSFYYTLTAEEDDNVFTSSYEAFHTQRPMTKFMAKLQDAMDSNCGYKIPSVVSSEVGSALYTPSPSPKLRHTALNYTRGVRPGSLRTQYSKAEPEFPVLTEGVPKTWQLNEKGSTRKLRVAPSLEDGLHADNLEAFQENATVEAAAIVHVEPDVVNIRRSEALAQLESRDLDVSDQEESDSDLVPAPLAPKPRPAHSPSVIGTDYDVSTTPIEILRTIGFSAAYGDAKCTELASGLYETLTESDSSAKEYGWDGRKQRLLLQSRLLAELKVLVQYGFMRDEVFGVIRGQIFPTGTTEMMSNDDFENYIRRAVSGHTLAEDRAGEILELAINDEDQEFKQTSPEDEVFFQREPFNEQGFKYDVSSSDECYERLGSLLSTAGTSEHWELPSSPEPEPRLTWWRSPFMSKMVRLFRIGYRKPIA
ncbi:hypothetical protein E8E12_009718 [Didymella heteroderae]|uniref:Uncharacterized protein n=1 Tax=Didymella heteroderae TaxID=1769908 RepID=A0A9P4X0V1_9PLEO|nr:hypothetical protein E8E12_009718 [Didymella heteroderae]